MKGLLLFLLKTPMVVFLVYISATCPCPHLKKNILQTSFFKLSLPVFPQTPPKSPTHIHSTLLCLSFPHDPTCQTHCVIFLGRGFPTTNNCMQNGSSVGIRTHCMHIFCMFGADLYAQSLLSNKISASELSRKFIKGPLLVG